MQWTPSDTYWGPTEEQNLSHSFTFPVLKDMFWIYFVKRNWHFKFFQRKSFLLYGTANTKGNSHLLGWEWETFLVKPEYTKSSNSKEKRGFLESVLENGRRHHPISFSYYVTSDNNFGIFNSSSILFTLRAGVKQVRQGNQKALQFLAT